MDIVGGHYSASYTGAQGTWPAESFKSVETGFLTECTVYYPERSRSTWKSRVFSSSLLVRTLQVYPWIGLVKTVVPIFYILTDFVRLASVEKGVLGFLHWDL